MSGGSWRSRHPGQGSARGLKGRLLLVADHLRGGRGDRQPPEPVGFVVVVDQDGCLAVVGGQAVQRQRDDILGPPTGGDEDLDRGAQARGGQVPRWSQTCRRISGGRSRPGSPCSSSSGMSPGLRATWLVSPAVGPPIALIAGKLLVLQPAISQLVADAQTAGLTVDGPDGLATLITAQYSTCQPRHPAPKAGHGKFK
jgi:hypothetical protein